MKKIIAFFIVVFSMITNLFKKKGLVKIEKETLVERMEKVEEDLGRRFHRHIGHPQHNNRSCKRNKRGARSRYVQYTPSGKPIFHTVVKQPSNF